MARTMRHAVQCRTVFYVRRIIGLHAVLVKADIKKPVQAVFDAPVSPYGVSYAAQVRFAWCQ